MGHIEHSAAAPFAELVGAEILDLIFQLAPRKVATRIGKACDHYMKARQLMRVDDEMGAIRCIAAEEELVVAIFEWLKLNADKAPEHRDFIARYKNHRVKLAFYPVLSQFRFVLSDMLVNGITIPGLEDKINWKISVVLLGDKVNLRIADAKNKELIQINPLAIAVNCDDLTEKEVVESLFKNFSQIVFDQRGVTVREFVTTRADYRNKLLYADDSGFVAMAEDLEALIRDVFATTYRDLLWCLAVLLSNEPALRDWGIVSQFIALYRRVLTEAKLI